MKKASLDGFRAQNDGGGGGKSPVKYPQEAPQTMLALQTMLGPWMVAHRDHQRWGRMNKGNLGIPSKQLGAPQPAEIMVNQTKQQTNQPLR